jgi:hypothetical protein
VLAYAAGSSICSSEFRFAKATRLSPQSPKRLPREISRLCGQTRDRSRHPEPDPCRNGTSVELAQLMHPSRRAVIRVPKAGVHFFISHKTRSIEWRETGNSAAFAGARNTAQASAPGRPGSAFRKDAGNVSRRRSVDTQPCRESRPGESPCPSGRGGCSPAI